MVKKTNKLPIKDILAAIDMKATNVWDDLSDDEKKQVSFYLLNRYASAIKGPRAKQELTILKTNEYYNKNWNILGTRHPKLQWQLLCATHNASRKSRQHVWQGLKQKGGDVKVVKWLKEMFPNMKEDEVNLLATISTKQELKQYAEDHGLDKKDVKL